MTVYCRGWGSSDCVIYPVLYLDVPGTPDDHAAGGGIWPVESGVTMRYIVLALTLSLEMVQVKSQRYIPTSGAGAGLWDLYWAFQCLLQATVNDAGSWIKLEAGYYGPEGILATL